MLDAAADCAAGAEVEESKTIGLVHKETQPHDSLDKQEVLLLCRLSVR